MAKTAIVIPQFRTGYNYDRDQVSQETGLDCTGDPGFTQQQFAEDADINEIVRRFGLTGQLPNDLRMPEYGDFTNIGDFHTAMNTVRAAEEEFMRVPATIRARFAHDPQQLMAFLADENNRDEAVKLGLVKAMAQSAPATPPQPEE